MRKVARVGVHIRLVRIGRDGKNRYCLYHFDFAAAPNVLKKVVVAGKLTKLEARGMLKLLER